MKKYLIVVAILLFLPAGALANLMTIYDTNFDRYGGDVFNVFSITVETDSTKPMYFSIATNYPEEGGTASYTSTTGKTYEWNTLAADLLLDVGGDAKWDYAIPLVNHYGWYAHYNNSYMPTGGYLAGHVYEVDYSKSVYAPPGVPFLWYSSAFEPEGNWSYNNTLVWLARGTPTGFTGSWEWVEQTPDADPETPAWNIVYTGANWDFADLATNGYLTVRWATATCGNDTIEGTVYPRAVPEPATMLLLGFGLIGLAGFGRKKLFNK